MRRLFLALLSFAACVPGPVAPERDAGPTPIVRDAGVIAADGGPLDGGGGLDAGRDAGAARDGGPVADRDDDGIPDDEDPAPDSPNTLLFSDHFDETGPRWIFSSVTMGIDPAESRLAVKVVEPFEREGWIGPEPTWGDYLIRTYIRVGRVGNGTSARSGHAGLIARVGQVTPSRYVTCGIDLKRQELVFAEHEGTIARTLASVPATFQTGEWLRVNLLATNQAYTCTVDGVELTARSPTFFAGSIGFRTYDATFAADWVEVYEIF